MKEQDFLFIGPQAAGKTCIMNALLEKDIPKDHWATDKTEDKRGFFSKTTLCEIGGKEINDDELKDALSKAKHICLVFNGPELLEEVKEWQKGGINTSFITYWYRFSRGIRKNRNIWYIATHKDKYYGKDLAGDIKAAINDANEEYHKLCDHLEPRYIFHDSMNGSLFAINALNSDEVIDVYHKIKKQ